MTTADIILALACDAQDKLGVERVTTERFRIARELAHDVREIAEQLEGENLAALRQVLRTVEAGLA